jgi:hypothetical protein
MFISNEVTAVRTEIMQMMPMATPKRDKEGTQLGGMKLFEREH